MINTLISYERPLQKLTGRAEVRWSFPDFGDKDGGGITLFFKVDTGADLTVVSKQILLTDFQFTEETLNEKSFPHNRPVSVANGSSGELRTLLIPHSKFGKFTLYNWQLHYFDTTENTLDHNLLGLDTLKYFEFTLNSAEPKPLCRFTLLPEHSIRKTDTDSNRSISAMIQKI